MVFRLTPSPRHITGRVLRATRGQVECPQGILLWNRAPSASLARSSFRGAGRFVPRARRDRSDAAVTRCNGLDGACADRGAHDDLPLMVDLLTTVGTQDAAVVWNKRRR